MCIAHVLLFLHAYNELLMSLSQKWLKLIIAGLGLWLTATIVGFLISLLVAFRNIRLKQNQKFTFSIAWAAKSSSSCDVTSRHAPLQSSPAKSPFVDVALALFRHVPQETQFSIMYERHSSAWRLPSSTNGARRQTSAPTLLLAVILLAFSSNYRSASRISRWRATFFLLLSPFIGNVYSDEFKWGSVMRLYVERGRLASPWSLGFRLPSRPFLARHCSYANESRTFGMANYFSAN